MPNPMPPPVSSNPGITDMEGTTPGLTAFLCCWSPKPRRKQGAVLQAWLPPPPTPIYFLVYVDAGQVLICPFQVPWRGEGLGGPDPGSAGAQAVQLLAVYIGCFILHRMIHAKVGWASWADVPICTELNKVGLLRRSLICLDVEEGWGGWRWM